ncbi:CDP-glycerol glycerophosphotransferase family protein [bacterium]|nr:CDP-glycerol glycerophosphotransferase family protein [bacterium]
MENNIKFLSKKCKNKKVVFYCIGKLFEELWQKFDLKNNFKIEALCDMKFDKRSYKDGILCVSPQELKNLCFDYLIIVSPDFDIKEKYLKNNAFLPKNVRFLNTEMKKVKINIEKNYKNILKKIKTKEKINLLFVCEQNEKWCYSELYNKLKNNNRFNILPVLLFPIISKGEIIFTQNENKNFFDKLNIESKDGWDYQNNKVIDIETFKPDIVFYQQPWYLNNTNHPKNVSKYALTIMAPYGYTTLSEKEWGSKSVKEVYQSLWLFLAESPYHIKFYKKAANMKNNLATFGSLKLDNYRKSVEKNLWKKPENFKIIYAPHHSLGNDGLRMATFEDNYEKFLNFAKNNQQYSFIFKPHPMLKTAVVEHNLMTLDEYMNYLKQWDDLDNSLVYDKGEYFDIFKTSDILITDCSSFLAEYFPTKKPIIFINRKDRAAFDDFGNKIKKGFYEANAFDEIETLAKEICENNNDYLLKTRQDILKKYFYFKESTCDEFIKFLNKLIC